MKLKSLAKSSLLSAVSALTGRHAVLLPREARSDESILRLSTNYRVEDPSLEIEIREEGRGSLTLELLAYEGHFATKPLWKGHSDVEAPVRLSMNVETGTVALDERTLGQFELPLPGRRFCWRLELVTKDGTKRRTTGHYLVSNGHVQGADYYSGSNYVDYEAEAREDVPRILELFKKYGAQGPVLEVGCATGVVLEALQARGFEVYGIDVSEWAVAGARERVGIDRVFVGNAESAALPDGLRQAAPFQALVLWAVLEHFREPFRVLAELSRHVATGALLFLNTTNARSLNHVLFGSEWEGYFDASHHGVAEVSVTTLREELPKSGWCIRELETHLSWDSNVDPTHASLREWWAADARFRWLLRELDRGDLVTCVAERV